jgi:opacity protein-like surface antigen
MYIHNMKRTFTLLIITLITLTTISVKAQDVPVNPVKSYIGIYGGLSTPQGDYAQSNYDNNKAGFAKRGATFGLDGAFYFYKGLGVGASITFQDQGELTNNDANTLAVGYTGSFSADQSTVTAVNRYHSFNFLIGPQYTFVYHKFLIDLRADAGLIRNTTTPEITTDLIGVPNQTKTFYQRSARANIIGYGGNLGIRYKFSDSWTVGIRGSYIDSQGLKIVNDDRQEAVGRLVTKQPLSELQTTVGLTLSF